MKFFLKPERIIIVIDKLVGDTVMLKEYKILSPSGIVGYGFPEESWNRGIEQKPDLIACDAGSTDPGPYYLGSGKPFTTPSAVKRDMGLMLKGALELGIPMVIGSCGGSGGTPHLEREIGIIKEIAKENGYSFKMAAISSEFDKEFLVQECEKGNIVRLGAAPEVTPDDIRGCRRIVAQMGVESIIKALDAGAQVVLCVRWSGWHCPPPMPCRISWPGCGNNALECPGS